MKIGKFAKTYQLTIDSVRHYMEMGLLLPEKDGSQYHFDEYCCDDIGDILDLKESGFRLDEIRDILYLKRLSTPITYEKNKYYKKMYATKHKEITQEIKALQQIESKLSRKMDEISAASFPYREHLGMDVNALSLLACPECRSRFILKDSEIRDNLIISGALHCNCGRSFAIEDGIIRSDKSTHMENPFGNDIEKFFLNYLKHSSSAFIHALTSDFRWLSRRFKQDVHHNSVILELGIGYGVFLRNVYECLSDSNIYIAVDHNISILRSLREMLRRIHPNKMIVLICADSLDLPLQPNVVDVLIDAGGNATRNTALFPETDQYMKEHSIILGSYITHPPSNRKAEYHTGNRVTLEEIRENINQINYSVYEERASKEMAPSGDEYAIHADEGSKVSTYVCALKR
ncbi:MerR family transcriptional regulator [Paenibacillus sp. J5C_2022]|uniref:MerR family transcriptional regulator n=1 Tax=Paenibacillus sp. J5C2022 TaxID=2977129 RepID=UPI0021CDFF9B|nr:MerR family transcriptional regulator [Paenibacillus sp. J5C2022]MCU6712128.1 MerR family transcriptional regulator [Paenibacillus sp. J5C2022]